MLLRFTKLWGALGLLIAMWALSTVRQTDARIWIRPIGTHPGPVRILQFYASVGTITVGEKAQLCYGVENARSVRIAPISQLVYPSNNRCLDVVPVHTTHYTILAEGFDGKVAMKSLTLPVQAIPISPRIVAIGGAGGITVVTAELPVAPTTVGAGKT